MILPAAPWAPDLPASAGASARILNCLPASAASFGPMPSPAPYSGPLGARCQGALAVQDAAGNVALFAGDADRLYRLGPGATAWSDVSAPAGYATPPDQRWEGAVFGDRVLMSNFADPIQSLRQGIDAGFGPLAAAAPRARHLAVVRDWLVAGNTFDPGDGARPERVWWSAIDDPTLWPAPGGAEAAAAQSDFQDLVGDGGWVQGIVGNLGTADGAVFQERGIVRMSYVGAPAIFAFATAEGARGTPAPGSIAQLGSLVYYLGEDGFYVFDGSASRPIGADRIDKTFFADLDQTHLGRVSAAIDPVSKTCFWAYPGAGNSGGNPNRLLAYNWAVDRWSLAEVETELLFRALSFGTSLEGLDAVAPSLDALPFSLDSRAWTGGRILLAGFDAAHRLAYFNGAPLAPAVETAEIAPAGNRRAVVTGARPLVEGGVASVAIGTRERPNDPVAYGQAVAADARGFAPQRASGRYLRARITLPAGSDFAHIAGVEIDAVPEGGR
jgi:hypothetical protein